MLSELVSLNPPIAPASEWPDEIEPAGAASESAGNGFEAIAHRVLRQPWKSSDSLAFVDLLRVLYRPVCVFLGRC